MVISSSALSHILNSEKNTKGGVFTIKSLKTGKDFTYKISRSFFKGKWFTHVKVEVGYMSFVRLGSYFRGKIYNKGNEVNSSSAVAIAFVLSMVEAGKFDFLDQRMQVMHLGSCIRCGRALTDAQSIEVGLGPVCIGL